VNVSKVYLLKPNGEERAILGRVCSSLGTADLPVAAKQLGKILFKIDSEQHLQSREVEDVRVWLEQYGPKTDLTAQMNESMWRIVR
jgi:hypothetical protein